MKYKNNQSSVIFEAQVLTEENGWDLEDWCKGTFTAYSGVSYLDVPCVTETVRAYPGDYIVLNPDGRFSVLDKQDFESQFSVIT